MSTLAPVRNVLKAWLVLVGICAILDIARAHPGESVLVVAHGGTLRRAQETALGEAHPVVGNCAVWAAVVEDGDFRALD